MPYHIKPESIIDGTLYTLIVFSVLTWTLILLKIWQFAKNSYYNRRFNKAFWECSSLTEAKNLPGDSSRGPQSRIAGRGFAWLEESRSPEQNQLKYCGVPGDLLEHVLVAQMQKEQHSLENGLVILASVGSTAPFVGLFGTVLGIMHAMHEITASGSTSLDVVAGPIGDALIATAVGIAVAVPAVLAYNFFLRSAKKHRSVLENFVTSFMTVALNADNKTKE